MRLNVETMKFIGYQTIGEYGPKILATRIFGGEISQVVNNLTFWIFLFSLPK